MLGPKQDIGEVERPGTGTQPVGMTSCRRNPAAAAAKRPRTEQRQPRAGSDSNLRSRALDQKEPGQRAATCAVPMQLAHSLSFHISHASFVYRHHPGKRLRATTSEGTENELDPAFCLRSKRHFPLNHFRDLQDAHLHCSKKKNPLFGVLSLKEWAKGACWQ